MAIFEILFFISATVIFFLLIALSKQAKTIRNAVQLNLIYQHVICKNQPQLLNEVQNMVETADSESLSI